MSDEGKQHINIACCFFLVDTGKAGFSTGECDFFKISQIFLKTQKGLFLNSEKEHQVLLPLSALAGFTQFIIVIPLRVQRDRGTHPWPLQWPTAQAGAGQTQAS